MYTYVLADYIDYTGENEIYVLRGGSITQALIDYCIENDISFVDDPDDDLSNILYSINIRTEHRINIIKIH